MKYSFLFSAILSTSLAVSMDNKKTVDNGKLVERYAIYTSDNSVIYCYPTYTTGDGLVIEAIFDTREYTSKKRSFVVNTLYPQKNPTKFFSKKEPKLSANDKKTIQWYRKHLQEKKDEEDKKTAQNGKKHLQEEDQSKLPIKKRKIKGNL